MCQEESSMLQADFAFSSGSKGATLMENIHV